MSEGTQNNAYEKTFNAYSPEEWAQINQLKRFFEWAQGDPDFRQEISTGKCSPKRLDRLRRIGVTFDLAEVAMFWKEPEIFGQFVRSICWVQEPEMPDEVIRAFKKYPLLDLWARYTLHRTAIGRTLQGKTYRVPKSPKFDAWRLRRIAAVRNELGFFGHHIDHPILSFELGDGCSIGCWFCAFAARKLTKNFDYPENRDFFRQIAHTCVDLFGKQAANWALLYYGTEPHDNPHYLDFIKDYGEITGGAVCTSTAVVTDTKWLRALIAYYRQGPYPWPRLSVLSKAMLFKIHDLYSPDELRDVGLLMQMKDQPRKKVTGGRILDEQSGLRDREAGRYLDGIVSQGSISCISGFLVNMVHRTIQLVSPCYTSEKWPYGYRIFDETTFEDVNGFRQALEDLIDRNMPASPSSGMTARFRDDLVYRPTDEGFDLVSPNQVHHLRGKAIYGAIGALIAAGDLTYNELYNTLMERFRINPMIVMAVVKKLFDGGFLDELNPTS